MFNLRKFRWLASAFIMLGLFGVSAWIREEVDDPVAVIALEHTIHHHASGISASDAITITPTSLYSPTLVGEVRLGAAPHGVAVTPDGKRVYVTDFTARSVSVIDAVQLQEVVSIQVGRGAVNVIIASDGTRAYVTNELDDTLSVIDTATNQVIKTISLPDRPHGLMLGVDPMSGEVDRRLYVANLGSNVVSVIDTQTFAILKDVAVGNTPDSPAVTKDGRNVWVTNYNEDLSPSTLSLIDALALTEIYTLTVGIHPHGIKLAPDDRTLYVSGQGGDEIVVVDTASRQVIDHYAVGNIPHGLGLSPDGRYLWTGDQGSRTSTVVDAQTGVVVAQLATGQTSMPHVIAFAPDGSRAYITDFTGRRLLVADIMRSSLYLPLVVR